MSKASRAQRLRVRSSVMHLRDARCTGNAGARTGGKRIVGEHTCSSCVFRMALIGLCLLYGWEGESEREKDGERERERERRCPARRSRGSIIRMWSRYRLSILPFARLNIQSIDPFSRVSVTTPAPFAPRHGYSLSPFRPFFVRLPPTAIPYSRLDFLLIYSLSLSLSLSPFPSLTAAARCERPLS